MFLDFVQRHGDALSSVRDRKTLSRWHREFAGEWVANAKKLAASGNKSLGLSGNKVLQPEVGYLAVEQQKASRKEATSTWILLSANPGWHSSTSAHEKRAKGLAGGGSPDLDSYERYRTAYFPSWYKKVVCASGAKKSLWWNSAAKFLHDVAGLEHPAQKCAFHPRLDIIGWELWPFHSERDGLTSASSKDEALRDFAMSSFRAACRMDADGVIVASAAGYKLLRKEHEDEFTILTDELLGGVSCSAMRHSVSGRRVFAIGKQLFASWSPSRATRAEIVEFVRGCPRKL